MNTISSPYLNFLETAKLHGNTGQDNDPEILIRDFRESNKLFQPGQSVAFLLDFARKKYLSMGPGVKPMLGYAADYVLDGGLDFILSGYHAADAKVYFGDIFMKNINFLRQYPVHRHPDFVFSYNYRFKNHAGEYLHMLQRFSMIQSAPDGTPLVMLAFLSDITHFKTDSKIIHTIEQVEGNRLNLLHKKIYASAEEDHVLTKRELEILKWICEGFSSKQIADKLYISIHTVHNHRKNMLEKTNSANVAELISYAIQQHIL